VRKLIEILWGCVRVCANVQDHEWLLAQEELHREGGAINSREASESQDCGRHASASVTSGDDCVGEPFAHEIGSNKDRGALSLAKRLRGVLIHADDIWSVHDARIRRECAASKLQEEWLIANKDQLVVWVLIRPTDATWDYLCGTVVAAHCIECKADAA
jgi:hypothetical protein